jgi:hypothetical protein
VEKTFNEVQLHINAAVLKIVKNLIRRLEKLEKKERKERK